MGHANKKEYMNELLTRKQVLATLRKYDRENVDHLRQWIHYKSQPIWRRAKQRVEAWWAREWTWPPREPSWWPESLSWETEEEEEA